MKKFTPRSRLFDINIAIFFVITLQSSFSLNATTEVKTPQKAIQAISRVVATQQLVVINESSGVVEWVAEVGDNVKRNQMLLKLDTTQLELKHSIIQNKQKSLNRRLTYNRDLLNKTQTLHMQNNSSKNEVDRMVHEVEQLTLHLQENKLQLKLLQRELDRMVVLAPFDGTVVTRNTNLFQFEEKHGKLLRFVGVEGKELEVPIPSKYLFSVDQNSTVSFSSRFGDFTLPISSIIPRIDLNDSIFKVRTKLPKLDWIDGEIIYTKIEAGELNSHAKHNN
jgi:RND family efflux transporter MFP subunit